MAPDEEEAWESWEPQLTGTISQLSEHDEIEVPKKQPMGFDLRPKPRIRVKAISRRVC
jgi:hypothetical protein